MGKKLRDVCIDADHILYALASPQSKAWKGTLKGKSIAKASNGIGKLKKAFKQHVSDYVKTAEVESILHKWGIGETIIVISDKSNFRYDIFPEYKANRKGTERTAEFLKLRKWARKKYSVKQNVEADDVVAYYVRRGAIGFSEDKDLLKGVPGLWYDCYHTRCHWVNTSEADAHLFSMLQCVMGDGGDGIDGIPGIGPVKAKKLLDANDWTWEGVVRSYIENGYTEDDAILTKRLVSMEQWTPKKGVKLFEGKKK